MIRFVSAMLSRLLSDFVVLCADHLDVCSTESMSPETAPTNVAVKLVA